MTRLDYIASQGIAISIHIPRVGDDAKSTNKRGQTVISIHIPRVGDDNSFKLT